jgi:hypothetical protein
MRSYYERDRRSKKWWHRLLFSLLETTLVNSWISHKDLVFHNMATGDDKGEPHELLDFKRSVTMSLLARGLNSERQRAGRIGRLAPKIHPSAQVKNKRRKSNLSVGKELRFENVDIHIPIFSSRRGRCECCQSHRTRTVRVVEKGDKRGLESRPFSKCQTCGIHLCLSKKRNCFKEFHDKVLPSIASPLMRRSLYTARTLIRLKMIALEKRIRSHSIAHPHRTRTIVSIVMTVIFVMIMKLIDMYLKETRNLN